MCPIGIIRFSWLWRNASERGSFMGKLEAKVPAPLYYVTGGEKSNLLAWR